MLKETQLCSWTTAQAWSAPLWSSPSAEDNLSFLTMSSIMAQLTDPVEVKGLPLKVTARDQELLETMAQKLPNVSSTSDPAFSHAMQLIDGARELDQKIWAQQFPEISDARVGRIVDLYLQLYDVEGLETAGGVNDLLGLRPGLTAAQGYKKAHVISLDRDILFKLSQKGLTLSTAEKLTPLAALSLVWWLHQEHQPTLSELSAAIYWPENKEIQMQAAILYNHSHYGNRYGDIAGVPTADLNDWGLEQLGAPELPVSRAVRALRVIHEGMDARPAILQAPEAYLANGFAPKNAQGRYLKSQSPELGEMILNGCGQIGFDACSQQDFTQYLDFEHAVGSLSFSLKTTLKLHYQLQGKALDGLEGKDSAQLYNLLLKEEEPLHQAGGALYSPTAIFLSHFSQSNEVEPLTLDQTVSVFKRIAGSIDVSALHKDAQITFERIKQIADSMVAGTAIDVERGRFEVELIALAKFFEPGHPLHTLVYYRLYKSEQEKIQRQLDYLNMRLAYSHLPDAFDDDQAIREILTEAGVKKIDDSRAYYYRYSDPHKQNDSPVNEFKRRRDASNRFVANMSMPSKNGRSIDVFKTMAAKKAEYNAKIKADQIGFEWAVRSLAIKTLIEKGQRPEGRALQNKINAIIEGYRPESENTRFWRNAWTSLEESWACKLPLPNPMCTIARVEGPRSRNENENMAAGMVAMVMEAGQLRGMERGVKLIENSPLGVKPSGSLAPPPRPVIPSRLPVAEGEVIPTRQTIPSPHGKPVEVQWVELKDPLVSGGMREAWVRPGGGASYWEVDLTTGKDLGVVLKQGPTFIKQGRLPGGGPSLSKPSSSAFNPEIKLGKRIGRGNAGDVFLDANNPDFVLKKLSTQDSVLLTEVHMKEVEYFNRYYGEGSAEFIKQGNQHYIRMYRVPGKTLIEINSKIYPPNAKERFLSMMDDLGYNNIIHNDLNFNNVLYDKKNNTFYPIDFDNAYDGYYSASDPNSGKQYWGIKMRVGFILEHIEEYALT